MSEQRVTEILARPSGGSKVTELCSLFLLAALASHYFAGKTVDPMPPTKPCTLTLADRVCPK